MRPFRSRAAAYKWWIAMGRPLCSVVIKERNYPQYRYGFVLLQEPTPEDPFLASLPI